MFLLQDARYALRSLSNSSGFAAAAVLTLAVGIGANTAIFSFVDGILLRPLPYKDADRIVRVMEKPPRFERNGISTLNYLDWQKDNHVFDFTAAQAGRGATLTGVGDPVQIRGALVSAHYFDIFGIQAERGRTFVEGEDQLGENRVVVISHALWANQFGSDPSIINRSILLDNIPHAVIGVLPAGSAFDRAFNQIWRPLAFEPSNMTRNFHWLVSFARLKPGVTFQQAQANMSAIGARIEKDFPDSNKGWGVIVERYGDTIVGPELRTALLVLITATALVLLIACANLANLALARGISREREVALRASLGAGRGRLVRQFLTENVLIAVVGGVFGLGIGYGMMRWLQLLVPTFSFAREADVRMDARVLLFTMAISVVTGLLFGVVPALQATSPDLTGVMKDGGRGSTDFASVALLLSGIGIYGVISYSVAQRTHEIGIRAALGATEARLMGLILQRGVILAGIGLVGGVAGSLGLTRLMESLLFGVGARDPLTMTLVAVVLALVAVLACYVPARRATTIDPLRALRI